MCRELWVRISAFIFHYVVRLSQCLADSLVFAWKFLVSPLKLLSGFGARQPAVGGGAFPSLPAHCRLPVPCCLLHSAESLAQSHLV